MSELQAAFGSDSATTARIAAQNDSFRRPLGCAAMWEGQLLRGRAVSTPGFREFTETEQSALIRGVIGFEAFDEGNDPWGLHDFGIVAAGDARIFWKMDLYDPDYCFCVDHEAAAHPRQVRRVLTLYLPLEH
ncbi:DUF3768 domain-containing protein [Paracoccus laeviglucosivorans]|uniref:DUF3768 domain-containing protein n=1 Tax=Paracoccus laeviglucosivorans TaxID=1197861 RepID=A0A521EQA7_9RHOB|nr:DUF3768 domain-containing protein [Paracoccus laeviglucosivorans]SMO86129.1 Protein of unknown function [Paracoccus laeviglucosivorans]